MKNVIVIFSLIVSSTAFGQTNVDKTIPTQPGQKLDMHFDYPQLVKVSTWDKNEISIRGTVSINNGESDDAFKLEHATSGNEIEIRGYVKDIKSLPQRITVARDGQKMVFSSKEEFKKYQQEHGRSYSTMSWGANVDIELEVTVPKNMVTRIESVYGMVEVTNFTGPLTVEATYGGVDAALAEHAAGEITAETNYGEIYSNLDAKFGADGMRQGDFHTFVAAKPGKGPKYSFESKYGNVYLRKATQ